MNKLRYSGIILMLLGVSVLAYFFFRNMHTNETLISGLIIVIMGFILQIVLMKRS